MSILKVIQFIPDIPGFSLLAIIIDPLVSAIDYTQPLVTFIFDLMFSVGFAEGLAMIARSQDQSSHHKLVWMSMNVGRNLRERPERWPTGVEDAAPAVPVEDTAPAVLVPGAAPSEVTATTSPGRLPQWTDDGAWSLF